MIPEDYNIQKGGIQMKQYVPKAVRKEYMARRVCLATAAMSIKELFDKAMQLLEFTVNNNIRKEEDR